MGPCSRVPSMAPTWKGCSFGVLQLPPASRSNVVQPRVLQDGFCTDAAERNELLPQGIKGKGTTAPRGGPGGGGVGWVQPLPNERGCVRVGN